MASERKQIEIPLSFEVVELICPSLYVANELELLFSIEGELLLSGAVSLVLELHPDRKAVPNRTPLAAKEILITDLLTGGPHVLSASEMNQDLDGFPSKGYYLVAYLTYPDLVPLRVVALAKLWLFDHPASGVVPTAPTVDTFLTDAEAAALYATLTSLAAVAARVTALELLTGQIVPGRYITPEGGFYLTPDGGYYITLARPEEYVFAD